MGKQTSAEQVQAGLSSPSFGNEVQLIEADPICKTPLRQDILELDYYDGNPRDQENPLYLDIKESILKTKGVESPIAITRRPGAARRMVHSGGNTRLRALKEIYLELLSTGDPDKRNEAEELFRYTNCIYYPWVSESHTFIAHLTENSQRSPLSLVDEAKAVKKLLRLWESEQGIRMKQLEFVRQLADSPHPLSQTTVSRLMYIADMLLPIIPETLNANLLGTREIDQIRQLKKVYRNIWVDKTGNDTNDGSFDAVFANALGSCDGTDFKIDALKNALDTKVAEILNTDALGIRQSVDAHLNKSPAVSDALNTATNPVAEDSDEGFSDPSATASQQNDSPPPSVVRDSTAKEKQPDNTLLGAIKEYDKKIAKEDIDQIRMANFELADNLARYAMLSSSVVSSHDAAFGFAVEMPDQPLWDDTQKLVWWLLLDLSGQDNPAIMSTLPDQNMYRLMSQAGQSQDIANLVGYPVPTISAISNETIQDEIFNAAIVLINNCRKLRKLSVKQNMTFWI